MVDVSKLETGDIVQNTRTLQRAVFVRQQKGVWAVPNDRATDWCVVRLIHPLVQRISGVDAFSLFYVWGVAEIERVSDLEQLALVETENARVVP